MELTNATFKRKKDSLLKLSNLIIRSFQTHTLLVPAMIRNFLMFSLSQILLKISPFHRKSLHLGKNVRIQRLQSLVRIGHAPQIHIGNDSIIYEHARLEALGEGKIFIGNSAVIGDCRISSRESVYIGNRVLTSWNVFIQDNDPHPLDPRVRGAQVENICRRFYPRFGEADSEIKNGAYEMQLSQWKPSTSPVVIGDDVWIGANTIILKGTHLGQGCIVAGGSVVVGGHFPAGSIVAGNPARIVKQFAPEEIPT